MNELFIRGIRLPETETAAYPYSIPAVQQFESVQFTEPVTFFVGENGSGKSTLIEALAVTAGFNEEGGSKNYNFNSVDTTSSSLANMTLIRGFRREKSGYFLRAESFYTLASYAGNIGLYNEKSLHEQSHGEAFLTIINSQRPGLFIFDEPESALSPQRQLALLTSMHSLVQEGSQFIIATHSPIILSYPGATIYELSQNGIEKIDYDEADIVRVTRDFLDDPSSYLRRLLN